MHVTHMQVHLPCLLKGFQESLDTLAFIATYDMLTRVKDPFRDACSICSFRVVQCKHDRVRLVLKVQSGTQDADEQLHWLLGMLHYNCVQCMRSSLLPLQVHCGQQFSSGCGQQTSGVPRPPSHPS